MAGNGWGIRGKISPEEPTSTNDFRIHFIEQSGNQTVQRGEFAQKFNHMTAALVELVRGKYRVI